MLRTPALACWLAVAATVNGPVSAAYATSTAVTGPPEGTVRDWRVECGGNAAILPGLIGLDAIRRRPTMPYPQQEAGPNIYGRVTNAGRMSGYLQPEIRAAYGRLAESLIKNGILSPSLRELVIVRVGFASSSLYEAHHHASFALALGLSRSHVLQMACRAPSGMSPRERAAIALADELTYRARPSDKVFNSLRKSFSNQEIMELVLVISNWMMAARKVEITGVPVDGFAIGDDGVPITKQRPTEQK